MYSPYTRYPINNLINTETAVGMTVVSAELVGSQVKITVRDAEGDEHIWAFEAYTDYDSEDCDIEETTRIAVPERVALEMGLIGGEDFEREKAEYEASQEKRRMQQAAETAKRSIENLKHQGLTAKEISNLLNGK